MQSYPRYLMLSLVFVFARKRRIWRRSAPSWRARSSSCSSRRSSWSSCWKPTNLCVLYPSCLSNPTRRARPPPRLRPPPPPPPPWPASPPRRHVPPHFRFLCRWAVSRPCRPLAPSSTNWAWTPLWMVTQVLLPSPAPPPVPARSSDSRATAAPATTGWRRPRDSWPCKGRLRPVNGRDRDLPPE